jgi:uncharacterized membrane protein
MPVTKRVGIAMPIFVPPVAAALAAILLGDSPYKPMQLLKINDLLVWEQ